MTRKDLSTSLNIRQPNHFRFYALRPTQTRFSQIVRFSFFIGFLSGYNAF